MDEAGQGEPECMHVEVRVLDKVAGWRMNFPERT